MPENTIFYIVFLSQIILISYHYPKVIKKRMQTVLEKYAPSDYPKLYPVPTEKSNRGRRFFSSANQMILIIGLVSILVIVYWDSSGGDEVNQIIPFIYFVIQMLPIAFMELSGFAYFKLMRKADKRTTKKADMTPRNLFNFISPGIFGLAVFMNVFCVLVFSYSDNFEFRLDGDLVPILLSLLLSNILYGVIIYIKLKGKKFDPYQSTEDRVKQMDVVVKSLIYMSIGASLFLIVIKVIDEFQLEYLEAAIMSLYLQFAVVIGLGSTLNKLKIDEINFDVYKNDTSKLAQQGE